MGSAVKTMDITTSTMQGALKGLYGKLLFLSCSPVYKRSQVIRYAFGEADSIRAAKLLAEHGLLRITAEGGYGNIVCIHVQRGDLGRIGEMIMTARTKGSSGG